MCGIRGARSSPVAGLRAVRIAKRNRVLDHFFKSFRGFGKLFCLSQGNSPHNPPWRHFCKIVCDPCNRFGARLNSRTSRPP